MIGHNIILNCTFEEAIQRVTDELANQGFGVITRINMHETFAEKLGVDFRPYTILGACNPRLAHKAVSDRPEVGLLLPCNLTVEQTEAGVVVRIPDAAKMLGEAGLGDSEALEDLAKDAGARLSDVAKALS